MHIYINFYNTIILISVFSNFSALFISVSCQGNIKLNQIKAFSSNIYILLYVLHKNQPKVLEDLKPSLSIKSYLKNIGL